MSADDKKLLNALQSAFPAREDFDSFLVYRCGVSLEVLAPNAGTGTQYFKVLRNMDARGLRIRLLWRAWFHNPGNATFTSALRLASGVLPEVSDDALRDLRSIVEDEEDLPDTIGDLAEGFLRAYELSWSDLQMTGRFDDDPQRPYAEFLGALASKKLDGGAVGLFVFARMLLDSLEEHAPRSSATAKLEAWMTRVPGARTAQAVARAINAYPALMIQLREAAQDVFSLEAWETSHGKPRRIQIESTRLTGVRFDSVPYAQLPLVMRALCLWFERLLPGRDITIEFILPLDLMDRLRVEEWTFTAPGRTERWSARHRLCVRPYERLSVDPSDIENEYGFSETTWRRRWQIFVDKRSLHHVFVDDEASAEAIDEILAEDGATCAKVRSGNNGRARLETIRACVGQGFGVVLWLRCTGLPPSDLEQTFDRLASAGVELLDEARALRRTSPSYRNLVVLWDDPARVPPALRDLSID